MPIGIKFKDLDATTDVDSLLGVAEKSDGTAPGYKFTYKKSLNKTTPSDAAVPTEGAVVDYAVDNALIQDHIYIGDATNKAAPSQYTTIDESVDDQLTIETSKGLGASIKILGNSTINQDVSTTADTVHAALRLTDLTVAGGIVQTDVNGNLSSSTTLPAGSTLYPITQVLYLDGNRVDTYTPDGSINKPFKTFSAAVAAMTSVVAQGYELNIAPCAYTEASLVTLPNVPIAIYGNNSQITFAAGFTIVNPYYAIYDLNIIGNVIMSSTSSTGHAISQGGSITGNVTINGSTGNFRSTSLLGGTVTINSPANITINVCVITSQITGNGIILMENTLLNATKSTPLITSTTGGTLFVVNCLVTNLGTGGCISCNNGADGITRINAIGTSIITAVSGNAISCGTSATGVTKNTVSGAIVGTGYFGANFDVIGTGTIMGLGSDAAGDMYYRAATGLLTRIAPNSTATKMYLSQTSSGAPSWFNAFPAGSNVIYFGKGGNDSNDGLTWETRVLTPNQAYTLSQTAFGTPTSTNVVALRCFDAGEYVTGDWIFGGYGYLYLDAPDAHISGQIIITTANSPFWINVRKLDQIATFNSSTAYIKASYLGYAVCPINYYCVYYLDVDYLFQLTDGTGTSAPEVYGRIGVVDNMTLTARMVGDLVISRAINAITNPSTTLSLRIGYAPGQAFNLNYYNSSGVTQKLAPNTTTTPKFLSMTGTGSAGNNPTWETVTSVLPNQSNIIYFRNGGSDSNSGLNIENAVATPDHAITLGSFISNMAADTFTDNASDYAGITVYAPNSTFVQYSNPISNTGSANFYFGTLQLSAGGNDNALYFAPSSAQLNHIFINKLVDLNTTAGSYAIYLTWTDFYTGHSVTHITINDCSLNAKKGILSVSALDTVYLTLNGTPAGDINVEGGGILYLYCSDTSKLNFTGTGTVYLKPYTQPYKSIFVTKFGTDNTETHVTLYSSTTGTGWINAAADFPTVAAVVDKGCYVVPNGVTVTDNDATKTNTGMTFTGPLQISWDAGNSTWIKRTGKTINDPVCSIAVASYLNYYYGATYGTECLDDATYNFADQFNFYGNVHAPLATLNNTGQAYINTTTTISLCFNLLTSTPSDGFGTGGLWLITTGRAYIQCNSARPLSDASPCKLFSSTDGELHVIANEIRNPNTSDYTVYTNGGSVWVNANRFRGTLYANSGTIYGTATITSSTLTGGAGTIYLNNKLIQSVSVSTWVCAATASTPTTTLLLSKDMATGTVTMSLKKWTATGNSSTAGLISATGVIPAAFRPTTNTVFGPVVTTEAAGTNKLGVAQIYTNGDIAIAKTPDYVDWNPGTGTFGFFDNTVQWNTAQ